MSIFQYKKLIYIAYINIWIFFRISTSLYTEYIFIQPKQTFLNPTVLQSPYVSCIVHLILGVADFQLLWLLKKMFCCSSGESDARHNTPEKNCYVFLKEFIFILSIPSKTYEIGLNSFAML